MIFGLDPVLVAAAILLVTYALVILDRLDRSIIALLGAGAMIFAGVLTQEEAIRGIDFNTIALLAGMMVLVAIARRSGIFEFLAIWSTQRVKASPAGVLVMLSLVTAAVSALLNNITVILLVAPVTLSITQRLRVAPFPFLFSEIIAANIGGTATLIGDPPNIMIGSAAGLSFNDFVLNLTPAIVVAMACQAAATHVIWGRGMGATAATKAEVMAIAAASTVTDPRLLWRAAIVFAAALLAFIFAGPLRLEPGTIALVAAAALMLLDSLPHPRPAHAQRIIEAYGEIDWTTIFFFIGLFVLVHGLEKTGAIAAAARGLGTALHGNTALAASAILWSSAILSALIDNIPFVAAMIPLIKALAPELGGNAALPPLWWALALGACLGGSGTLVGAAPNLTVAGIAQRSGIKFDFVTYTKFAAPLTVMSIIICQIYLWLRYL